jgi:hypothetical protein
LFIAIACAFIIGVLASDRVRATAQMFSGEKHLRCIDNRVCIGAIAPNFFGQLDDDKHGLTALFCDESADINSNIIFLDGIVRGDKCPGQRFTVELRSPTKRTLLKIDKGRLVEITEGPLYTIDL